jgi:DNA repair exonuclease SbcCD ATPase subunit
MTVFSVILIVVIFVLVTAFICFTLFRKVNGQKVVVLENLRILQDELEERRKILENLAKLSVGLITLEDCETAKAQLAKSKEGLDAEKGKATILQAESEAVDVRLRELEEIERELDSSGVEAAREMEMLRAQDRDIEFRNTTLFGLFEQSVIVFDKAMAASRADPEVAEIIAKVKSDVEAAEQRLKQFQEELPTLNEKYVSLKRAYDALDIEYAQLYEKQSVKD